MNSKVYRIMIHHINLKNVSKNVVTKSFGIDIC